jgi:C-terminal processing protease CtpA/Prc
MLMLLRSCLALVFAALFVGIAAVPSVVAEQDDRTPQVDESALSPEQQANVDVLDAVLARLRRHYYDRNHEGLDLAELRARYLARVVNSDPGPALHRVLREMLGEFKVSHLTIIAGDVYEQYFAGEMNNTPRRQAGFSLVEYNPGELFVANLLHGSAADEAGLERGDKVVRINGVPALKSELLADAGGDPGLPGKPAYFPMNPEDGAPIVLDIKRTAQAEELLEISITPGPINMIEATLNSIKVIEVDGLKLGYIRFWHFLHADVANALRRAINNDFKDCDGLIVDLRGRGGSPGVMNACFLPFGTPPPTRMRGMPRARMPRWDRPVVALQDRGSRSAKEVYAHNWKWLNIGPLVGEASPGAVLGSTFFTLPDESQLLYPAQRVNSLAYGHVDLEGNPVLPTHPVKDLLPYASGVDTIKQAGTSILARMCKDAAKAAPKEERPKPGHEEAEEDFSAQPAGAGVG